MADDIFLTVVIPTYNRAALLKRCVDSVLATTSREIEVLVSDNASPDETQSVLKAFNDSRLRYWRNAENVGAERNILGLWRAARGRWVFCLGDDDYLLAGALERILSIVKTQPEVGVVIGDVEVVKESGELIRHWEFGRTGGLFAAGMEAMEHLVFTAKLFSGITFRRQWADIEGTERHLDSMHPQMYLVASVLRDHAGLYVKEPFIAYTEGNVHFWEYPPDKTISHRIALIKDCLPLPRWKRERRVLIQQIIRYVASFEEQARAWKAGQWKQQQFDLLKVPEVRRSFRYWRRVLKFLLRWNKTAST